MQPKSSKDAANLKRRVSMLRFHASNRGEDGKSIVAQRGGRARMGDDPTIARANATEMAALRWYGEKASAPVNVLEDAGDEATGNESRDER